MACTKCGSEEWKSASLIHAGGLSTINTSTIGVGVGVSEAAFGGGTGVGIGTSGTNGTQQTELSKLAAPPTKEMRPAKATLILSSALFFISIIITQFISPDNYDEHPIYFNFVRFDFLVIVISSIRILFTRKIGKAIQEKHELALLEYKDKKMCLRCGTIYIDTPKPVWQEPQNIVSQYAPQQSTPPVVAERTCPFCSKTVSSSATKCEHCQSKISAN